MLNKTSRRIWNGEPPRKVCRLAHIRVPSEIRNAHRRVRTNRDYDLKGHVAHDAHQAGFYLDLTNVIHLHPRIIVDRDVGDICDREQLLAVRSETSLAKRQVELTSILVEAMLREVKTPVVNEIAQRCLVDDDLYFSSPFPAMKREGDLLAARRV